MITQRAVGALAVVEGFAVVEDLGARLMVTGKGSPIDPVGFERAPEAFHGGLVVAIAFAAPGGHAAGCDVTGPCAAPLKPAWCRCAHSWPSRRFCDCKGRGWRPNRATLPGFRC